MTHLRTVPSLATTCDAPVASKKDRLTAAALTLHVNDGYKPMSTVARIAGLHNAPKVKAPMTPGHTLARTIHMEFVHLSSEYSTSEGALVKLDFVPSETDMEEARSLLKGLGYVAGKLNVVTPRLSGEKPSANIWVEYDNADKPYFSKR